MKQVRETLEQANMKLIENNDRECVLMEESGCMSLWELNYKNSRYVIEIDGKCYEFVKYWEV